MAAEHTAIRVQLVDDHEPEILEQLRPARMVRQHAGVQHVGVAEHHVRTRADRTARILGCVAVVREDADLHTGRAVDVLAELVQLGELVLCQRFGRKQVERPRRGVLQDAAQHRGVVAQGLPRCRGCSDDDVAARQRVFEGSRLMRIELGDPTGVQGRSQARVDRVRPGGVDSRTRRNRPNRCDPAVWRIHPVVQASRRKPVESSLQCLFLGGSR